MLDNRPSLAVLNPILNTYLLVLRGITRTISHTLVIVKVVVRGAVGTGFGRLEQTCKAIRILLSASCSLLFGIQRVGD